MTFSIPNSAGARLMIPLVWVFIVPSLAFAITAGQVDNFTGTTTDNWTDGHLTGANVANITTGGPAGANDHYLQVSSGTFGGDTRLITFNQTQWIGNYVTAKVVGVKMDLKNFGTAALPIRIAIREGTAGQTVPGYASTTAFSLPADSQWHKSAFFAMNASSLTPINSPGALATDLANVKDFRLLSSAVPSTLGDAINARIGVDNITAIPLGDANLDGARNITDVQTMLTALRDVTLYKTTQHLANADLLALDDINADGKFTNADVEALIVMLANGPGGAISPVPEPAGWILFIVGALPLTLQWRRLFFSTGGCPRFIRGSASHCDSELLPVGERRGATLSSG
jgi:hypothetical protein